MQSLVWVTVIASTLTLGCASTEYKQGLVGAWYRGDDLTRVGTSIRQSGLDLVVDTLSGHGNDWSAQWVGFVTSPVTGKVTFRGASNKELIVEIADKKLVQW